MSVHYTLSNLVFCNPPTTTTVIYPSSQHSVKVNLRAFLAVSGTCPMVLFSLDCGYVILRSTVYLPLSQQKLANCVVDIITMAYRWAAHTINELILAQGAV